MEHLIFSMNATMPVFMIMIIGGILKKVAILNESFIKQLNQFVFQVGLPILLFHELATANFYEMWDVKFVSFCFISSLGCIGFASLFSKIFKFNSVRAEFVQASYRSSAALLGCAFIENIYGTAGPAALMIIGAVPLYNIVAIYILNKGKTAEKGITFTTLKQIMLNPIIIGIAIGALWSVLRLPLPVILQKTASSIGQTATPLGLMALGATFKISDMKAVIKPASLAAFLKLIGFVSIFLPIAVGLGFREEQLVALLVMLGAATTVSCYIMAKNTGYEGVLTSTVILLTTLLSAFTLTGWLYGLSFYGLI